MTKKNQKKIRFQESDLTHSYTIIKDDLLKLKKDLSDAYRIAREKTKKQVEIKLNQSK
jgi:hypothetical protein